MCTSWSSANQISNFKFSAFFRVLFALWSLKYPHPKSQQTPRVSTELEMVVNLSYSSIPLQKISQKGVDRSVENPQKRAENIKMVPNAPNKFSCRMRNKMPLCWFPVPSSLSELSRIMATKILKNPYTLTDSEDRQWGSNFLRRGKNQYTKRKTESYVFSGFGVGIFRDWEQKSTTGGFAIGPF